MSWPLTIFLLVLGLALIIKGGDVFVDAAAWMAEKTGVPKLIVGATIVSIATTLPEMLISFMSAGQGKIDMGIGNAIGSVTVNIGLIMGIALICMPAAIKRKDYLLKTILMLGATTILVIFGFSGEIGLLPSILLLILFAIFMSDNIRHAKAATLAQKEARKVFEEAPQKDKNLADAVFIETADNEMELLLENEDAEDDIAADAGKFVRRELLINVLKFILGATAIVIGSDLLIDNGSLLATMLGVPERIIAVTLVAIGTSLPELVTTITAIAKKEHSLSVGNIIGANIIDLTVILPISSLIAGQALPVSSQLAAIDIPACLIVGCIAMLPTLITGKFNRWQGIVMLIFYIAYLLYTTGIISLGI